MCARTCNSVSSKTKDIMRRILNADAALHFWEWAEGDPDGMGLAAWWIYENDLDLTPGIMKGKRIKITIEFEDK